MFFQANHITVNWGYVTQFQFVYSHQQHNYKAMRVYRETAATYIDTYMYIQMRVCYKYYFFWGILYNHFVLSRKGSKILNHHQMLKLLVLGSLSQFAETHPIICFSLS